MENEKIEIVTLEYGDIIKIFAEQNDELHQKTFFINYIDKHKIRMINISNLHAITLFFKENTNEFRDESIEEIHIISKSNKKGYIAQNNLEIGNWIDIHFGGELPTIITGKITNIEEDQLEITMYPIADVIYIDFAFKGIPENIPIEQILIREKPSSIQKDDDFNKNIAYTEEEIAQEQKPNDSIASIEYTDNNESIIKIPEIIDYDKNIRENLHDLYIDANDVLFNDEEPEYISQIIELDEKKKIYSIDEQVSNFLDELLSTIPNSQRSKTVLEDINRIIERFKQLRIEYSKTDEYGNIQKMLKLGPKHKPLVEKLQNINMKLKWILPIVTLKKKIYSIKDKKGHGDLEQNDDIPQIHVFSSEETINELNEIQNNYFKSKNNEGDIAKYLHLQKQTDKFLIPFSRPEPHFKTIANTEVLTNIETIVENLEEYNSIVYANSNIETHKFIIQKYNLGTSNIYGRKKQMGSSINTLPNETMYIKSFMMLPEEIVRFSKIELPATNIMWRTLYSHNYPLLFRMFHTDKRMEKTFVEKNKEYDYEKIEKDTNIPFLTNFKEFVMDMDTDDENENMENNETNEENERRKYQKFETYLNQIIPNTNSLIGLFQKYISKNNVNGISFVEFVKILEPFMIYSKNITYGMYVKIRYFIKQKMMEYKKEQNEKTREYRIVRDTKFFPKSPNTNTIHSLLNEKEEIQNILTDSYKQIHKEDEQPSEILQKIMQMDCGNLIAILLHTMLMSLTIPQELMDTIKITPSTNEFMDEMIKNKNINSIDCSKRFLTKRYKSIKELQNDNHKDIYYDKEFDNTPYELLKDYKKEKEKMTKDSFLDFFAENLIQKHGIARNISKKYAETIILGKKQVTNGEYAMVEIYPSIVVNNETGETNNNEYNIEKIYYIRVNNIWKKDEMIDAEQFIDNNTLFCNLTETNKCMKKSKTDTCEEMEEIRKKQLFETRTRLMKEFDARIVQSIEITKEKAEKEINAKINSLLKIQIFKEIEKNRINKYFYDLGKTVKINETVESPYLELLELILSQEDFIKKQKDIITFVDKFAREPLIETLNESEYWYYCKETNTQLVPNYMLELAKSFVSGGSETYSLKLKEISRKYGTISEDGDSIVDKLSGSGRVIQKIEYVEEELFDDAGFRIMTGDIMDKDMSLIISENIKSSSFASSTRIFENKTTETIHNILITICRNIGISNDNIEDFVIRTSYETIQIIVMNEDKYESIIEKKKKKGEKTKPYEQYYNQNMILIVAFVTFVAIQTSIPSFRPTKTVPGCIFSFEGFPMENSNGEINTNGLEYIACVLNISKSVIAPWSSINGIKDPVPTFIKNMKDVIAKHVINRKDVMELYANKQNYLILNPEETVIPENVDLKKWKTFYPPLIEYSVNKQIQPLETEYFDEFKKLVKNDKYQQWNELWRIQSKNYQYSFGIIEYINDTVKKQNAILKTSSNIPFLQNACCNEDNKKQTILNYFIEKTPEIQNHCNIINKNTEILEYNNNISTASLFIETTDTRRKTSILPIGQSVENIYTSFIHYCKFDLIDAPIPEYLKTIIHSKPSYEYNPRWNLQEKINFLKENGKRFTEKDLYNLISLVNNKNLVELNVKEIQPIIQIPNINGIVEYIEDLEYKHSTIIEKSLREKLISVLSNYRRNTMLMGETDEINSLKNYLIRSNKTMMNAILEFIYEHRGKTEERKLEKIEEFMKDIMVWENDNEERMITILQYIKNAIYEISVVFPEMIINKKPVSKTVPSHWDLSKFHQGDIEQFTESYYYGISQFYEDIPILNLLGNLSKTIQDIRDFIKYIPIIQPIRKKNESFVNSKNENLTTADNPFEYVFFAIFDKETTYILFQYLFYSVIYEYIQLSENPEVLKINRLEHKKQKQTNQQIQKNQTGEIYGLDEEIDEEIDEETNNTQQDEIINLQVQEGNVENIKIRIVELLRVILTIEKENKNAINKSYKTVSEKVIRSKLEEKKTITDYFKNLSNDERKLEKVLKVLKMGRWNLGLQKGVFQYDKEIYDNEHNDIIQLLTNENGKNDNEHIIQPLQEEIQTTVEEMERDELQNQENDENDEYGGHIYGDGENDGVYYENDQDDYGEFGDE
jgi:hypothetical protein